MAANAVTQLFENTEWGDIDYMFIDFPPGTGDIQLDNYSETESDRSNYCDYSTGDSA